LSENTHTDIHGKVRNMKFFDLLSLQYTVLLIFGGVALVLILILACYSDRIVLPKKKESPREGHRFPGDLVEGNSPVPLVIALVIAGLAIWGVFYVIITSISGAKI